jgi:hypothetical protein
MVGAGPNGSDYLVGFGSGKNELHVLGRLFNNLEKRIKSLGGDHVCLVEDENLEAVSGRREDRPLTQFSGVVNAVVAGSINLDDVERTSTITREFNTTGACATRSVSRALLAV